jgi:hypothetical protein
MCAPPRWSVEVWVKRSLTVVVEAASEDQARIEAENWNIIADELAGDTVDVDVIKITRED